MTHTHTTFFHCGSIKLAFEKSFKDFKYLNYIITLPNRMIRENNVNRPILEEARRWQSMHHLVVKIRVKNVTKMHFSSFHSKCIYSSTFFSRIKNWKFSRKIEPFASLYLFCSMKKNCKLKKVIYYTICLITVTK